MPSNADSPVDTNHLLTTNAVPNALEAASLRCGMAELEVQLQAQRAQVAATEARLKLFHSAFSALRRVPHEVLSRIFVFTVQAASRGWFCARQEEVDVVSTLGLVCRDWRKAALLANRLWAEVTVHGRDINTSKIFAWLGRAGSVPKSVHLEGFVDGQFTWDLLVKGPYLDSLTLDTNSLTQLCDDLDDICAWRGLRIEESVQDAHASGEGEGVRDLPWDRVRHLGLDLQSRTCSWVLDNGLPYEGFLHFLPTHMTSLAFLLPRQQVAFSPYEPGDVDVLNVPLGIPSAHLEKLVSLEFSCDWDGPHLHRVLKHCPNLVELTSSLPLYIRHPPASEYKPRPELHEPVVLPHLKTLRLRRHRRFEFLNCITAPGLHNLDVEFGEETHKITLPSAADAEGRLDGLTLFPQASNVGATIEWVRFANGGLGHQELTAILTNGLHGLTHLTLENVVVDQVSLWTGLSEAIASRKDENTRLTDAQKEAKPIPFARAECIEMWGLTTSVAEIDRGSSCRSVGSCSSILKGHAG